MVNLKDAFVGALVSQVAQEGAKGTINMVKSGLQSQPNTQITYASEPQQGGSSIVPLAIGVIVFLLLLRKKNNK